MNPSSSLSVQEEGRWLCSVCLDLTLYFSALPALDDLLALCGLYLSVCPKEQVRFIKTTDMAFWQTFPYLAAGDDLLSLFARRVSRGKGLGLKIWNGNHDSSWSLTLHDVPALNGRPSASFCQILIPPSADAELLHTVALHFCQKFPFLSGHAGYSCVFDPWLKELAFAQIFAWSRRFYGLDVQDLNLTLPEVRQSIKGTNWLTLVGSELASQPALSGPKSAVALYELPSYASDSPIQHTSCAHGTLWRAGERPVLSDRNRQEFPVLYAKVELELLSLKLTSHGDFAGPFAERGRTMAWFNRLLDPDGF